MLGKKEDQLLSPATGECVSLSAIPDEVFSEGMLGNGFGVQPSTGEICAPIDGRVESVAEAKHAYTILSDNGLDVLIHVGVDTVGLGGVGFVPRVIEGQRIRAGEALASVDLDVIRNQGLSDTVAVIVTNSERITNIEYSYGACVAGKHVAMRFRTVKKG